MPTLKILLLPLLLLACHEQTPHRKPPAAVTFKNIEALQQAAQAGNPAAEVALAQRYYKGEGVPKNDKQAMQWAQRAATQQDAAGQYLLGGFYDIGCGVPEEPEQAFAWFQKAAAQGHVQAQWPR